MKAFVFDRYGAPPVLAEVPRPSPGPGEVLLRVAGAGACHSDVSLYRDLTENTAPPQLRPGFVIGHETSGWVEEVGAGVRGLTAESPHLVYGPTGCGRCAACGSGQDIYCERAPENPAIGVGLGRDGGMAEFVVVPARNLVPLGDADPVGAATLADAGLTPYHAIRKAWPHLVGASTVLVIGLGGLGQLAVQLLKTLTGARVLATDRAPAPLATARELGAVAVPGREDPVAQVRDLTAGRGVNLVLDFVGSQDTIALGMAAAAARGRVTVVGIANGSFDWSFQRVPVEVELSKTYWGTLGELHELVDLFLAGSIRPSFQQFSLDEAPEAYRQLEAGSLAGRAVIVPSAGGERAPSEHSA